MSTLQIARKLPRNPHDGDIVFDRQGNMWEFASNRNTWVERGTVKEPLDVSEIRDGLVTPPVFRKLSYLRSLYNQDKSQFSTLKMAPGVDAYWYYFRSADKLFRFTPEGDNTLRIEIDRGRIFQILLKQVCPGGKGPTGDQGDRGPAGQSGAAEACFTPSGIEGDRLDFAIFVPTPITTSISLRLYGAASAATAQSVSVVDQLQWWSLYLKQNGFTNPNGVIEKQFGALRTVREAQAIGMVKRAAVTTTCNIPMSVVTAGTIANSATLELLIDPADTTQMTFVQPDPSVQLDQVRTRGSISYDLTSRVLCGSLYLSQGLWGNVDSWCVRARQVGPKGADGPDGKCMVNVVECVITDGPLLATCPMVSLRADCEAEILYWLCSELLPERCVDKLQLAATAGTVAVDDAVKSMFASAKVTTEQCKKIYRYQIEFPTYEPPTLDLTHWDPQPGCVTKRNFNRHSFDWIPSTDMPACNTDGVRWYGADVLNPTKFPWPPVVEQEPASAVCCSDSFFYCPNAQEDACPAIPAPVVIGGTPTPTPTTPTPTPAPPPPPPPAVALGKCVKLNMGDYSVSIPITKVPEHYIWGNDQDEHLTGLNPPPGPAWRGCGMVKMYGSDTSNGRSCLEPVDLAVNPSKVVRNVEVPVVVEIMIGHATADGAGGRLTCYLGAPTCFPGSVPTPLRTESKAGSGNWDCTNFFPTKDNISAPVIGNPIYCGYALCTLPDPQSPGNIDQIDDKVFQVSGITLRSQHFLTPGKNFGSLTIEQCATATPSPTPTPSPNPTPTPTPAVDQYGCSTNPAQQPCGQALFTGVNNSGKSVASSILIRDPFGDTILHQKVYNGVSIWTGCSIRSVPLAWVDVDVQGRGGRLEGGHAVPIVYQLACMGYGGGGGTFPNGTAHSNHLYNDTIAVPGGGRPTPSSATSYPTTGWLLFVTWPIRCTLPPSPSSGTNDTTPAVNTVTPTLVYNCGDVGHGGYLIDWYPPNFAAVFWSQTPGCAARPFNVAFTFAGVQSVFGTNSITARAIEQNYVAQSLPRMPSDDFNIPIVRI